MTQLTAIQLIESALDDLARLVQLSEAPGGRTHTAIVATGIEQPQSAVALGRYLTGALAGAIQIDATLSVQMLDTTPDARAELAASVRLLVGESNVFATPSEIIFRDTARNAWIAEGIGHVMFFLRHRVVTACLNGTVHALRQPHPRPSRQGLDLIAIYEDAGTPAIAFGEAKASREDGSGRLTKAAGFFAEIDRGMYGVDIRNELSALKGVLDPALAVQISGSLWHERRCYVPVIVHEAAFSPTADREAFARLKPPVDCRRVLIFRLAAFHPFFDAVSDAMRTAVGEVIP